MFGDPVAELGGYVAEGDMVAEYGGDVTLGDEPAYVITAGKGVEYGGVGVAAEYGGVVMVVDAAE